MLPAFSMVYGIHPWQLDLLTDGELEEYVRQLPRRREGGTDGT